MLTSTGVSDALDEHGVGGAISGLTGYSTVPLCAPAFTVRLCDSEHSDRPFNDYLAEVPSGAVLVLDNGGRTSHSVMGGLVCAEALRRGALGAVVRGAVRDIEEVAALGFGMYAMGRTPRSGRSVTRVESTGEPIVWDGVSIATGDVVVADGDGIAVVPADYAADVLRRAEEIEAFDEFVAGQVAIGIPLSLARRLDPASSPTREQPEVRGAAVERTDAGRDEDGRA